MSKQFKTYDELLIFLQEEKNLLVNDSAYAKQVLSKTSYFSLISGYKDSFKHPTTGKYKNGTTFDDIYSLYKFDHELRIIFLKYMLIAEHSVKSSLAYHFTELYGENQREYLSLTHYIVTKANHHDIQKLIKVLSYHITYTSDYSYVTHYKKQHHNVPLWIMIHILTVGQLSHMYDFLKASVPIQVCKDHHNISRKDMHSFLSVMTKHRNACAHGDRFCHNRVKKRTEE
ncbi:MAG: Abi family protein [Lachnospiraceae bacterium]